MTPDEMLKHMKEQEQRENELIAEANEICGAVKWDYKPFMHFPAGMWKVGAIWDHAYYETAEYIVDGVCNRKLNPYVHGAAGVFLFRHYVELALKYILFHSRWLDTTFPATSCADAIQRVSATSSICISQSRRVGCCTTVQDRSRRLLRRAWSRDRNGSTIQMSGR